MTRAAVHSRRVESDRTRKVPSMAFLKNLFGGGPKLPDPALIPIVDS